MFVGADGGAAVADAARNNNLAVSGATFAIAEPPAVAADGTPTNGTVAAGGDAWYRVDVPGGTALRVRAKFAAAGAGALHVDYRRLRKPDAALASATDPAATTEEVILSATQAGAHYVRVHGLAGGPFTLRADTLTFDLTRLVNAASSNQGTATLTVHGVGFTPDTTVRLVPAGGPSILPVKGIFVAADTVYATFDLRGLKTGAYDVVVTDGTRSATVAGGYTVTAAPAGALTYRVIQPATARAGEVARAVIEFVNTGGTDVPAPLLVARSTGAYVRLPEQPVPEGAAGYPAVYFLPTSSDAPAGLIPPGYHGTVPIEFVPFVAEGETADLVLEQINDGRIGWKYFKPLLLAGRPMPPAPSLPPSWRRSARRRPRTRRPSTRRPPTWRPSAPRPATPAPCSATCSGGPTPPSGPTPSPPSPTPPGRRPAST